MLRMILIGLVAVVMAAPAFANGSKQKAYRDYGAVYNEDMEPWPIPRVAYRVEYHQIDVFRDIRFLLPYGLGGDECSRDGVRDIAEVRREMLRLHDRLARERLYGAAYSDIAIEIRHEMREHADRISEWQSICGVRGKRR